MKQLKYFLQICKNKSFSEASKKLFITQQGLSKSIKNLEDEFELPLFYRTGNKIKLTKYGLFLKNNSINVIREFDLLLASIKNMSIENCNSIKIGYSVSITNAIPYDFLYKFKNIYPDIEIQVNEYQDFLCEEAVLNGDIDIGFTAGPIDESKYYRRPILMKKLCLIVNIKHRLSKKATVTIDDIKNEKFILPSEDFKLHHFFVDNCNNLGFDPNVFFTTADLNFIARICASTDAVGIGIQFSDIANVKFIPINGIYSTWNLCLITKKNHAITNNEKLFINFLLKKDIVN